MTLTISKWGNSAAIRLPKKLLDALSLKIGDRVNLVQRDQTIVIEPCKPTLDQLLARVTKENRHVVIIDDKAGNEIL